jgi:hypothetical protein
MANRQPQLIWLAVGAGAILLLTRRQAPVSSGSGLRAPVPRVVIIDPTTGDILTTEYPQGDPFLRGETPPIEYLCAGDPLCIAGWGSLSRGPTGGVSLSDELRSRGL